jgi:hypothetical protein
MSEEKTTVQEASSKNDSLYQRFATEREEWTTKVSSLTERLKSIYDVAELLTDLYSQRQIAGDYIHELVAHSSKLNRIYRERKRERYLHYTQNYDLRLDKDPKMLFIDVDLADIVERRELLQNHLDYMRETLRSIDTICYGVKHRIALEEYRRG